MAMCRQSIQPCAQHGQQDPDGIAEAAVGHAIEAVRAVQAGHGYAACVLETQTNRGLMRAEGDVDGIMDRPEGNSEPDQRAREKWYARDTAMLLYTRMPCL